MKKPLTVIGVLLLLFMVCGCMPYGTIYGVAVDERGAGTIVSDAKIKTSIQKEYLEDNDTKILDISVFCYRGEVYLVGEYEQEQQKDRAVKIAGDASGVRSVHTYLVPKKEDKTCTASDKLTIQTKINAKLVADMDIWSTNIDVKVVQCDVVLLGVVDSQKTIDRAIAHVKSVEGVREITSYLNLKASH